MSVNGQAPGQAEGAGPAIADYPQELPTGGEFLDPVIVGVGHVNVIGAVKGQAGRSVQLAISGTGRAPVEQVAAVRVVGGYPMQPLVTDEVPTLAVDGPAGRPDELATVETVAAEVAVVSAIQVTHGDPYAAGGLFLAAADHVEAVALSTVSTG